MDLVNPIVMYGQLEYNQYFIGEIFFREPIHRAADVMWINNSEFIVPEVQT